MRRNFDSSLIPHDFRVLEVRRKSRHCPKSLSRPKHRQRLNPRARPPCCIFRGFENASGYRGRQFDTGQHCFRSPIMSAPRFRQFVPRGTPSLSLTLSLLCLSIPVLPRPLCRYRRQRLELPRASSLRVERHGE